MNYLEIVLQGYFNENNREFLEKYFFREFKKAEKEQYFEADEFFNGCIKVIESWEKYLQERVFERKHELYLVLNGAKNGTMKYGDLQGKTIEEKRRETIEYCEQELKDVRPDGIGSISFTVHLYLLTNGRIAYNMAYNEVLQIKLSILKAFKKTQPNIEPLPPQPIVKQKPDKQETPKTFDELFYNTDLVKPCIDILKELDPPLIDTDCNYIGKLKGVFCVWIDEMQRQGIVKSNYPEERKLFASLIPTKIKRFSINESMFGKYQTKAENLYRNDIKTKVSNIKLSQNSH